VINAIREQCGMKYVLTWWERPGGSAADHEAAQKRILDIFQKWEIPETLTFHQFLVRVGEFGGYAVLETDDLAELEKWIVIYAGFQFRLEPVLDVEEAVGAQSEGIAWRDSNAPLEGVSGGLGERPTAKDRPGGYGERRSFVTAQQELTRRPISGSSVDEVLIRRILRSSP
jgi:hypothetical protein